MRGFETLVREYPNKTGKEILAIVEQDKLDDADELKQQQKRQHEIVKELNETCYFKGEFGIDQKYYYKITNAFVDTSGFIYMTVEKIVCFFFEDGRISIECQTKDTYQNYDTYMVLSGCDAITEDKWNSLTTHIESMKEIYW